LSYKNYGSFLHEHSLVFVKFFTNWWGFESSL
jgi:hypothetical protein